MSSIEPDAPTCFVVDGASPSTFVVPSEVPLTQVVAEDPELALLDLAHLSAREQEEAYGPGFYHNRLEEHVEATGRRNKEPVIVMSNGRYRFDVEGTPIPGAKLRCSTCKFEMIYRNFGHLESNIPEECGNEEVRSDCPLYHGRMRAQYDRRNGQ